MEEKLLKIVNVDLLNSADDHQTEKVKNFLQKLKQYKVESLKRETLKITDCVSRLDQTAQESAFENYQAFVNSSKSSRLVEKRWDEVTHKIDKLLNRTPNFTSNCDEFFEDSYDLERSCNDLAYAESKHAEVLNILDLPNLMQASIEREEYDNALELATYIQKLGFKLPQAVLIKEVIETIESSWHVMISQLLIELRCNDLSLDKTLEKVGFLRRMQAFTVTELKMKFLQERGVWFDDMLYQIPKNDVYQYLIRTVEVTRVCLFNIITQFKALFDDETMRDAEKPTHLIVNSWMHEKIEIFLKTFEVELMNGNLSISEIVAITNQCMYFGSSFSRIGHDFRAQIAPIFIRTISKSLKSILLDITNQFERDMEDFTLINREIMRTPYKEDNENKTHYHHPPDSILDFHPLAAYTNKLLILFNELKICVPLAVIKDFVSSINHSLDAIAKCILNFFKNERQAFSKKEQDIFLKLCSCFCYELIPYIQLCIHQVFFEQSKVSLLTLSTDPIKRLGTILK